MVVRQVFEHSGPEEVEVSGAIALRRSTDAGEVLCEDLFLEGIDCVRDAFEVVKIGDCAGNGGVLPLRVLVVCMALLRENDLRAGCEDSAGCRGPISSGNVVPGSC